MTLETVLYLDPWSGISGDMLLAALLDTDREGTRLEHVLRRTVESLGLAGAGVEVVRDVEWGLACTRVRVRDEDAAPLRHLADMERLITGAGLPKEVERKATAAVRRLAATEAAVHGCGVDEIHFHEVGAVDTLVDVVGAFALMEALGIERVHVGTIPVGGGTVQIAHGRMGVPAPATMRLLEGYPIIGGPEPRELTTPTGALLVTESGAIAGSMPEMRPLATGHGAGSMSLEQGPNVLRVVVGVCERKGASDDTVVELATNLDDVSAEVVGHAVRVLRQAGALDVWMVPAQMKKDRPGVVLHVLARAEEEDRLVALLFEETGTLGVRRCEVQRHVAERGVVEVDIEGQVVRVKWGRRVGRLIAVAPEYDDCAAASAALGWPLRRVMSAAEQAARGLLAVEEEG